MSSFPVVAAIFLFLQLLTRTCGSKNGGQILFPDSSNQTQFLQDDLGREIPLNIIRQLNNISDVRQLFKKFVDPPQSADEDPNFTARMGPDMERSSIREGRIANCMPELRTISLKPDKSRANFYYPSCTRIERCGGCCSHHLLSCQPVETEFVVMSIVAADYMGGNKLRFRGRKLIQVERHKKCKCDCKIRPEDCTMYQKYNPDKCQCECGNYDDERKCNAETSAKIWSKESCSCMCREEMECSIGFYFDPFTCSCTGYRSRKKPNFPYNLT